MGTAQALSRSLNSANGRSFGDGSIFHRIGIGLNFEPDWTDHRPILDLQ